MSFTRHGPFVTETTGGARPLTFGAAAVIAFVATAADASDDVFPVGKSVYISNTQAVESSAGTSGTLKKALDAINKQGGTSAIIIRVAEEANQGDQDTAVIGTDADGLKTGLQALRAAESKYGVEISAIGAPELDTTAVAAELIAIGVEIGAEVFIYANGATKEDAKAYRDNFGQREVFPFWPNPEGMSAVALALGMRAKIDATQGWHKTLSNVPVNGVFGLEKDVSFGLTSTTHDAHFLNQNQIITLVNVDGWRFWGNRGCSADPQFEFESVVRTAQVIKSTIAHGHLWAIDLPVTDDLIDDIVAGINAALGELVNQNQLIGAEVWYDPNNNPPTELADGRVKLNYRYTPVPPLEGLELVQEITDDFLLNLTA